MHAAHVLCAVGVALLFLEGTATVEVLYTVRPSYVLLAGACAVGFPLVVNGWRMVPSKVRWSAGTLFLAYVLAALVGTNEVVPGQARAGEHRDLVYLSDLILGLAVVGLIVGASQRDGYLKVLMAALLFGAGVASVYAIYQWPGQHFGWPVNDVNNALNTTGLSRGSISTGTGIFGWARVRGTFREPHLLAAFLGVALPIAVGALRGRSRVSMAAIVLLIPALAGALILTLSVSTWAMLVLGCVITVCIYSVARGRRRLAAVTASTAAVVAVLIPFLLANPDYLTAVTGRDAASLEITTRSRTDAWVGAVGVWSHRPALGYGPGQSAVRLAGGVQLAERSTPGGVALLGSAHGVPTAALIDAGLVGFTLWLLVLGSILLVGVRALLAEPTLPRSGFLAAALIAVLASLVAGDRLELFTWVILGALMASARRSGAARQSMPVL
jgi:hypothetical protein